MTLDALNVQCRKIFRFASNFKELHFDYIETQPILCLEPGTYQVGDGVKAITYPSKRGITDAAAENSRCHNKKTLIFHASRGETNPCYGRRSGLQIAER